MNLISVAQTQALASQIPAIAAAKADKSAPVNIAKIEQAAQDFEAVFLTEMFKPMFEGLDPDPTFGGGKGEEIFRGLMLQEYGKMVAKNDGIGIAKQVKAEMIRMQEASQK